MRKALITLHPQMAGKYSLKLLRTAAFLIALSLWLCVQTAAAQELDFTEAAPRPDPDSTPTQVWVSAFVFDIDRIDDAAQRFSIDFFLSVRWRDPRLAVEGKPEVGRTRSIGIDKVWTPRILVINNRQLTPTMPEMLEVDDTGLVIYRQRFYGELSANLVYNNFPYDEQLLSIDFISYRYSPDEITFGNETEFLGNTSVFGAEGWSFEFLPPVATEYGIAELNVERPLLRLPIKAKRDTNFYLLTMWIPMSLILFMSWMAFWLPPTIVPARMSVSTAAIFTLIAFGFSVRLGLPSVSYLTKADVFVILSTLMVFVALAITVVGSRWAEQGKVEKAISLNVKARWSYIVLFLFVNILARIF